MPPLRLKRTSLITRSVPLIRPIPQGKARAGEDTRPYEIQERSHSPRRGRSQTGPRAHTVRPYSGKRPRDVGSETAGAAVETHHLKFFTKSGPQWGRTEPRSSTPDFARRKFSACPKG